MYVKLTEWDKNGNFDLSNKDMRSTSKTKVQLGKIVRTLSGNIR